MSDESQTAAGQLKLGENLDLTAVTPLHKDLLSARGGALVIDASEVERIGGQRVQLLLSASKSWADDGVPFEIVNASDNFLSALALLGVGPDSLHVKEQTQ